LVQMVRAVAQDGDAVRRVRRLHRVCARCRCRRCRAGGGRAKMPRSVCTSVLPRRAAVGSSRMRMARPPCGSALTISTSLFLADSQPVRTLACGSILQSETLQQAPRASRCTRGQSMKQERTGLLRRGSAPQEDVFPRRSAARRAPSSWADDREPPARFRIDDNCRKRAGCPPISSSPSYEPHGCRPLRSLIRRRFFPRHSRRHSAWISPGRRIEGDCPESRDAQEKPFGDAARGQQIHRSWILNH